MSKTELKSLNLYWNQLKSMRLTCRGRLWVPGFICPVVRGIPWILLGSLGGPLGVHGRSMDQNSAVAAAGSTFFVKSASRCSPSQATSSRRPSRRLRDAHSRKTELKSINIYWNQLKSMKLTCRVRLWVPGFICPLVRGIPWDWLEIHQNRLKVTENLSNWIEIHQNKKFVNCNL